MARPQKTGIEYFPFDVDFFTDDKIQLIEAEFDIKGSFVAIRLLCKIYKEGYFYKWGSDESLLFAKNIGSERVSKGAVDEIVRGLLKRGFFDITVYNKFQVLTSAGIQKRFLQATQERKSVNIIEDYWLLDEPKGDKYTVFTMENGVIRPKNKVNLPNNEVNPPNSTQSKVKYTIEEENILNDNNSLGADAPEQTDLKTLKKEEEEKEKKLRQKKKIEGRSHDFYQEVAKYIEKYTPETLRSFFDYWSEPNPSKTKMRFEMERTWDLSRRLSYWARNEKPKNIQQSQLQPKPSKVEHNADIAVSILKDIQEGKI